MRTSSTNPSTHAPACAFAATIIAAISPGVAMAQPEFGKAQLFFELNATDGDIGLQGIFDAPSWREGRIDGPGGTFDVIRALSNDDSAEYGLNEILFESNEPPLEDRSFAELLTLFPPGNYEFTAKLTDGATIKAKDALTTRIPCPPIVRAPRQTEGDVVLRWSLKPGVYNPDTEVCAAAGAVTLEKLQVFLEVVNDATGVSRTFELAMPLGARSVEVPDEFLAGVTAEGWSAKTGLSVTEASGNRTGVELEFELR